MTTVVEAARELYTRRMARTSILEYAAAIDVPGRPVEDDEPTKRQVKAETKTARHHRLLLEAIDRCSKTVGGRLMVFMPPGSAKSTYASVVFPSCYLGFNPGKRLILASYGDTLAVKMGRRTRGIIKQARYKGITGTELSPESKAADNFILTNGSEYMACGILSGITGNRANGIIIDDPIKGREQANSETIRNKTWDAYQDDLLTRLVPGGWLCLIQTRWHEDDLAGRILPVGWNGESGRMLCQDGNEWEVLCIQAQCEVDDDPLGRKKGEYLWPEWFTEQHWNQYKTNPRTWGALFQQRPSPLDGNLFKPEMIHIIDAIPSGTIRWCRGWDLAATQDDGDYTAGLKMGQHIDGRVIIADVAHGQWGVDVRDTIIRNTADDDGKGITTSIPQDPGAAGKAQVVVMGKLLIGHKMHFSPESGDKETRAGGWATQVNIGNVYMVRASWNKRLKDEMRPFPDGTYDDIIDAGSRAFNFLNEKRGPIKISSLALNKARG